MTNTFKKNLLSMTVLTALTGMTAAVNAQDAGDGAQEEVVVTGIRSALQNALVEKRAAQNIKEVIKAEDIGKLPDQNLAEVLENVTGIQITRAAGVGTGVQIRGTGANRVEINGVSTVSAGDGRGGIGFDDLPAALIGSVEITKVPTAKTIEGSVGGTINLRTLRGLELKDRIISVRAQMENSDLADSQVPRLSGTFGDNWTTEFGDVGVVTSLSYVRQDVASFDPRFDRDREVLPDSGRTSAEAFPFLRTQFLDQQLTRYEYETKNLTTSVEWAPTDDWKFYADFTFNDQERAQKSARALFSGTGGNAVVDQTNNTEFETVNLGTIDGPNGDLRLGSVQAVLEGVLGVGVNPGNGSIDPNLRIAGNTSSRLTESTVFAFGSEWTRDKLLLTSEVSYSASDTTFPSLNTTLDFVNPNGPQPVENESIDNGVPAIFDASGDTLQFGIAPGLPETPSTAQLLEPANYAFRQFSQGKNTKENTETAFRVDADYDISDSNPIFVALKAGIRWNQNTSESNDFTTSTNFTSSTSRFFRPRGNLFSGILTAGPDNFDAADGRRLFVKDYLMVNPETAFGSPEVVKRAINQAIVQSNADNGVDYPTLEDPSNELGAFFDIEESTTALYLQGDYELNAGSIPLRGNIGLRYVSTELDSVGNNIQDDQVTRETASSSYTFLLPRLNLVAEVTEDILVRAGIAKDIRRPQFDDLSTSIDFPGGASSPVQFGNPALKPEKVTSYDLSVEYYLSNTSFVSAGIFYKDRTELFSKERENPVEPTGPDGQIERDITDPCEEGGIYNPIADRGVWSSQDGVGICVPFETTVNIPGNETQKGIELAFQYDLSDYEDSLGWASGFGVIANYTHQEAGGSLEDFHIGDGDSNALNDVLGRTDEDQSTETLADDVVLQRKTLTDLSEDAYNATLFYDKYGLNLRMRYTWRSSFVTNQLISFDLPRIVDDRAQLNMSASYAVNDNVTVGVEGVNLLREDRTQWCVNEGALFCSQGLTDRRILFGVTASF